MEEYLDESGEEQERAEEERKQSLVAFAQNILDRRKEAIEARSASGVERRWREDQDAFDGLDEATKSSMLDYATGEATVRKGDQQRSKVLVNIIRGKTETAAGRFSDISMPIDDKNWGLKPTPVPELNEQIKDQRPAMQAGSPVLDSNGKQVSVSAVAADIIETAKKRMTAMETEINDQLTECTYNSECRKAIWDAAKLGTGVIKGPSVVKRYSRRWMPMRGSNQEGQPITVHEIQMTEEHKPSSRRVDPWNVYPDPACGDEISKAGYVWERDTIRARGIKDLIGLPGYFDDQLIAAMNEQPRRTVVRTEKGKTSAETEAVEKGDLYEIWEYNGDVSIEDLESIGCSCPEGAVTKSLSACAVFINDRPVKVVLNVLDTGELPYDFFQWVKISDSVWGAGVPRMLIWQQRIITAAWRATMDNAGDSAGAQRVVKKDVEPADGNWTFTRNKIWWYTGDDDARTAFVQHQLDSRQQELQAIMENALKFADLETSIPSIFQGEGTTTPETLGATNIMVDSNNVSLRQRVKRWDDQITVPHLTRYYHYNMMYNEKEDIKGDFQVDARGVRVLLEKDQQSQVLVNLWPLLADPEIAQVVDKKKAAKQLFAAHRLDILKPEEQIAQEQQAQQQQAQQQQPDPATGAAQVRAQAQLEVAKLNQQSDMEELKLKQAIAEADRAHEVEMKKMDLQIAMLKMANDRNISLDSIKAALATDTMKLKTQKELSALKGPQITMPPTEPIGKAPTGEAYQR